MLKRCIIVLSLLTICSPVAAADGIKLANVWSDKPLARTGEVIQFSSWVENTGDRELPGASLVLDASEGAKVAAGTRAVPPLAAGAYERVDWEVAAEKPGPITLKVLARLGAADQGTASYRVLVIDPAAKYTRQELCTDEQGYWRLLPRPATLQGGNAAPLTPVEHKKSADIGHNTYGICTHVPRSRDYEAPFAPTHLIDDDPETCWSSQQNSSMYPGRSPWAEIDLGKSVTIKQVNLVPYWHNTDFPLGFRISTSGDGQRWQKAFRVVNHHFDPAGPKRGDKAVQAFPLPEPAKARYIRIEFERLPLSGGNYAEVSQGYKARLSGIEVLDEGGQNVALAGRGASVKVSDIFLGWQNTKRTVDESFNRLFDIGFKWVRIGQWGDQTEWAAVERAKGKFEMDTATEAGIQKLLASNVEILYGLNYGNALYERPDKPGAGDLGPIFMEGHPFSYNGGPRTEAGREAFVRYVDFVVRRYKGKIKWWELWNEQNGWFPGHEPELYGKLLAAVAKHVKEVDPAAKVMFGGTAAPAPLTTEIALREGGAPYVDAYAFHPYGIDKPEGGMGTMEQHKGKNLGQTREQTGWNHLEEIIAGVKKPFAQHGRPDIDVWLNEWGTNVAGLDFTYKPGIGEYGCAKYMMRFYIYAGWLNAPTAWWALYNENKSQDWGILDQQDFGFRPMAYALQNVCSVVSDVTPVRKLDYRYEGKAPDPKVISYERKGVGETLVLVWAAEVNNEQVREYPSTLSFKRDQRPKEVKLIDLYWGVAQPAQWSYEAGTLTFRDLIVRDYPLVIAVR
jgi:hypothetical protein